jgi:hypothetical protein
VLDKPLRGQAGGQPRERLVERGLRGALELGLVLRVDARDPRRPRGRDHRAQEQVVAQRAREQAREVEHRAAVAVRVDGADDGHVVGGVAPRSKLEWRMP